MQSYITRYDSIPLITDLAQIQYDLILLLHYEINCILFESLNKKRINIS